MENFSFFFAALLHNNVEADSGDDKFLDNSVKDPQIAIGDGFQQLPIKAVASSLFVGRICDPQMTH